MGLRSGRWGSDHGLQAWGSVMAAVREHFLAALRPEGIEPHAPRLQQFVVVAVAQLYCFAES